mmetsp:Transcript_363/g.813  ORF Transcript_363/g.813 Transcript_363/m.813 type:complete len:241 (-) Transcript_363:386-1108(-)
MRRFSWMNYLNDGIVGIITRGGRIHARSRRRRLLPRSHLLGQSRIIERMTMSITVILHQPIVLASILNGQPPRWICNEKATYKILCSVRHSVPPVPIKRYPGIRYDVNRTTNIKWRSTREEDVKNNANRPHISLLAISTLSGYGVTTPKNLWGKILRSTAECFKSLLRNALGKTKIGKLDGDIVRPAHHEDVFRLQVAVDDILGTVEVVNGCQYPTHDPPSLRFGVLLLLHDAIKEVSAP